MNIFMEITNKDLDYLLAQEIKKAMQEVLNNACNDLTPLNPILLLPEDKAEEILVSFQGTDRHSIYIRNGELYYDGDGSLCMPSTREILDILSEI